MQTLTVSKARAGFSRVTRGVIKSGKAVTVRTPHGLVQIAPVQNDVVKPATPKSLKRTKREVVLGNTLGDSL
jgi:hypothetical protein